MPVRFRILAAAAASGPAPGAEGPAAARAVEIADGLAEIRIGRRADLEASLPFPALSAVHARVSPRAGGWVVEDLGSTNGSWLDDQRLIPGAPQPLRPGGRLLLAHVALIFDGPQPASVGGVAEGTGTIARRLVSDLFAASPDGTTAELEVMTGPAQGRRLALRQTDHRYVVGRDAACDLPLPLEEVSREHAAFTRRWEGVFVRDLGSKNGVRVAGAAVTEERRLSDGDTVDIGPVRLNFRDPEDRYLRELAALADAAPAPEPAPPPVASPHADPPAVVIADPPSPAASRAARLPLLVAGFVLLAIATIAFLLVVAS